MAKRKSIVPHDILEENHIQEYLENIIALLPGHIFWKDLDCRFLGCNDLQAKTVGLKSRHDIVGKSAYDVINKNLPEKIRLAQAAAIDEVDREIMRTGISQTLEEPLILEDGSERIFISYKIPLRDKKGNIIGLLGNAIDVTEQRKLRDTFLIEKEQVKVQAAKEKEGALTVLASGIGHDLRSPLTGAILQTNLLTRTLSRLKSVYEDPASSIDDLRKALKEHLDEGNLSAEKINKSLYSMNDFIDHSLQFMKRLVSGTLSKEDFQIYSL
ncbi:MAG: PAS domain-containing protein [Gammaproteobacteria bacterium]